VTELVVEDGRLSVAIRDAGGAIRTIETPFDPSREIYVDFVVLDGRLWIRRVFDDRTPPEQGVLVDPALAEIDWSEERAAYGKATYRALGPGRWIVSVTGDGSLGLARSRDDAPSELRPAARARLPADRPRLEGALGSSPPQCCGPSSSGLGVLPAASDAAAWLP
jgi:hypothetical protein